MSRSLKTKNDNYIDSTSIMHNRELLSELLEMMTPVKYVDNEIVPTNEFVNGKRVYAKRITTTEELRGGTSIRIKMNLPEYSERWVDLSNSYYINDEGRSIPIVSTYYVEYSATDTRDMQSASLDGDDLILISNGGWGIWWKKVVIVKFTYKNEPV